MNWQKNSGVRRNYPLKDKNTFRLASYAEFFSEPEDLTRLRSLLKQAQENNAPVFVIGGGSNLLLRRKILKGLVIKLSAAYFNRVSAQGASLRAGGGVMLSRIIRYAQGNSLGGLEFLAGIPGTLGGALMMNAACWGKSIGALVKEAEVMDYRGRTFRIKGEKINFGYRRSGLGKYIILSSTLKLEKDSPQEIGRKIRGYILKRRAAQDLTFPGAGCIFKNPPHLTAGRLIDLCGLKGRRSGGACISSKHANFILNKGNARACDVLRLMRLAQESVKKRFKINLEPEVKVWG